VLVALRLRVHLGEDFLREGLGNLRARQLRQDGGYSQTHLVDVDLRVGSALLHSLEDTLFSELLDVAIERLRGRQMAPQVRRGLAAHPVNDCDLGRHGHDSYAVGREALCEPK
jgi:hypothetical protein